MQKILTKEYIYDFVINKYYKNNQYAGFEKFNANPKLLSFIYYLDQIQPTPLGITRKVYFSYADWALQNNLDYISSTLFTKELQKMNIFIQQTYIDNQQVRRYIKPDNCPTCGHDLTSDK